MKIHRGFPPRLDWIKIEEAGKVVNMSTHGHKISLTLSKNGKQQLVGWFDLKTIYDALMTIDPSKSNY